MLQVMHVVSVTTAGMSVRCACFDASVCDAALPLRATQSPALRPVVTASQLPPTPRHLAQTAQVGRGS